jgi:hypothetical protein
VGVIFDNINLVKFEVFTAVTMKNGVFWDVTLHVARVRTDISEKPSASFIMVTRISELGTTQAATSNRRTQHAGYYLKRQRESATNANPGSSVG